MHVGEGFSRVSTHNGGPLCSSAPRMQLTAAAGMRRALSNRVVLRRASAASLRALIIRERPSTRQLQSRGSNQ
eukprot:CAMPEP_0181219106 /NCGR_PEP_ID=MMETSP1096-20121128/28069_1 /TAXON_ID=156174 ORGANISM="Chrysochromulina ericina, Strain CCMP281" /NCGR_SAMPLE_ID=MMETSP1096 /ASSEMBLY_ACC=CAM_ASM_000453 /LENGTH=72 /DNA_ID=CAMNT_0023311405 /DNA_START=212 /DNA_END=430 /DNA_ORIENTATION=-